MTNRLSGYFVLFLLTLNVIPPVNAAEKQPAYESFQNVQFIKNYDGDSITFDIPEAPSIVGKNMVVRLRGIDTPELRKSRCSEEMQKAYRAKNLVNALLSKARTINLHRIGRGKYFRILADVEFDGKDLAAILLEKELAIPYSGGKRDFDWCKESLKPASVRPHLRSVLPPKISGVYVWPPPPVAPQQEQDHE